MKTGELILIRHGVTDQPGRLNGRTDVGLAVSPPPVSLDFTKLWVSPAKRARETAAGLFPGVAQHLDDRLWEQDYGVWEGKAFEDLPDTGTLDLPALADLKPEQGESFKEVVARVGPAIYEASVAAREGETTLVIVAHANVIRAALALAILNVPAALAFEIGHVKATRLRCHADGYGVITVNEELR